MRGVISIFLYAVMLTAAHTPIYSSSVVDTAGFLTQKERAKLTHTINEIEKKAPFRLAFYSVHNLESTSMDAFAQQIIASYALQSNFYDVGILLLVDRNTHDVKIYIGNQLKHLLSDEIAHTIIQKEFMPLFEQSRYYQAANKTITSIDKAIKGTYEPPLEIVHKVPKADRAGVLLLLLLVVLYYVNRINKWLAVGVGAFFMGAICFSLLSTFVPLVLVMAILGAFISLRIYKYQTK